MGLSRQRMTSLYQILEVCRKWSGLLIATPGVRRKNAAADEKRIATPGEAIASGVDYLVVGRPILNADDPVAEAEAFIQEMEEAAPRST